MADRKELLAVIREALEPGVFGAPGANWDPILCNPEHPCHHDLVRLCEQIGYGAVMSATSYLWEKKCGGSAHTVGTCYTTHKNWLRRAQAAVGRKTDSARSAG
ncbi:MAG: hypothetical protein ACPGVY_13830 [Mycobacterium sp.]